MSIVSIGQTSSQVYLNNSEKPVIHGEMPQAHGGGDKSVYHRTVDMRNVSLNEINALIKSGVDGLLDVLPFISPDVIEAYGGEYAATLKTDLLGQVESVIAFNLSRGEPTSFMQSVLANLTKIDGMEMPASLDLMV